MRLDLDWVVVVVKGGPVGGRLPRALGVVVGDEVLRRHRDEKARVRRAQCLRHLNALPVLHVSYLPELVGHEPPLIVSHHRFPVLDAALGFNLPNSVRLIPLQIVIIKVNLVLGRLSLQIFTFITRVDLVVHSPLWILITVFF